MALEPGDHFPALDLVSPDGTTTTLAQLTAGGPAVVHLMRAHTCAACTAHGRILDRSAKDGTLGDTPMVWIAPGGAEEAAVTAARLRGTAVQVWASDDAHADAGLGRILGLQRSGTYVLDADGVIRLATTAAVPQRSFDRNATLAVLEDLRAA